MRRHLRLPSWLLVLAPYLLLCVSGCGPADEEEPDDRTQLTATVKVPTNFTATSEQLAVSGFETLPVAGQPDANIASINPVTLDASTAYELNVTTQVTGNFHVALTLFVDGGGDGGMPVANVDYWAVTDTAHSFAGGVVALGEIMLEPVTYY